MGFIPYVRLHLFIHGLRYVETLVLLNERLIFSKQVRKFLNNTIIYNIYILMITEFPIEHWDQNYYEKVR